MEWLGLLLLFLIGYFHFVVDKSVNNNNTQSYPAPQEQQTQESKPIPVFQKREYFFSSVNERKFFELLKQALNGSDYTVFAQVRLADIVRTTQNDEYSTEMYVKTLPYQVDFLICYGNLYKIALAIELDSPYHHNIKQQERDLFKSKVLANAKIPLLRFRVEENLTVEILKARLQKELEHLNPLILI